MTEEWQELKETITEMRDNDGTCTQQEVCKFLANLMDVLENQMREATQEEREGIEHYINSIAEPCINSIAEPCEDWYDVPSDEMTLEQARQAVKDLRKKLVEHLEQEPCEDEYIKVPKKALKYRTAGMVVYNAEWLKNHFDIERAVICGAQEPCDDAISRQAVLDQTYLWSKDEFLRVTNPFDYLRKRINSLPPVIPQYTDAEIQKMQELEQAELQKAYELGKVEQPKMGRWTRKLIRNGKGGCIGAKMICSECGQDNRYDEYMKFCPNCGCRMIEPQKSEG